MIADGRGWSWMIADGRGWSWMVMDGRGWVWMVGDGRGDYKSYTNFYNQGFGKVATFQ